MKILAKRELLKDERFDQILHIIYPDLAEARNDINLDDLKFVQEVVHHCDADDVIMNVFNRQQKKRKMKSSKNCMDVIDTSKELNISMEDVEILDDSDESSLNEIECIQNPIKSLKNDMELDSLTIISDINVTITQYNTKNKSEPIINRDFPSNTKSKFISI
jgi:hypothetical protein